jgi:2,4-dienoyl-CoA reductase-like NADH-dependent reductase (Old Yellow Enzyme family)
MRFALEVVEAVRAIWPAHKPLFMRFSVEDDSGLDVEQSIRLAKLVGTAGVDVVDCSSGGISGGPPKAARPGYGYQVPYARRLRHEAPIATMAVGLIVHADQAEAVLQAGDADLVAIGREILYNPNWPTDAARKLGVESAFDAMPPAQSYWLEKRAKSVKDMEPSTYRRGLHRA